MTEMKKFPEGEHADLHLGTEGEIIDAVAAAEDGIAQPNAPDATAAFYDDECEEPYDYAQDLEDAKCVAAVVGIVAAIIGCILAIILGRKLASKE